MLKKLEIAVRKMISEESFQNIDQHTIERKVLGKKPKYELYLSERLKMQLDNMLPNYFKTEQCFNNRRFDLLWAANSVCEIGHERSRQGCYYTKGGKRVKQNGLINKLFFDYIKNYQYEEFVPVSYALLYFSIDEFTNNKSQKLAIDLIAKIKGLYTNILDNRQLIEIEVIRGEQTTGRILLIDKINDFDTVRCIFKSNHDELKKCIKDNEKANKYIWRKLQCLQGIIKPWDCKIS